MLKEIFNINNAGISNYYLGLSKTNPANLADPADPASGVTEPSGGNYKRIELQSNNLVYDDGRIKNINSISFERSTSNWTDKDNCETIGYWVLYDGLLNNAKLLAYGNLTGSNGNERKRVVEAGTIISIAAGAFSFSISSQ